MSDNAHMQHGMLPPVDHSAHHSGVNKPENPQPPATSPFYRENDDAMARMHQDMHKGPFTGDIDRDFLLMMAPHHQGAIDMAALVLRYGSDPLVREIAESIIDSQTVEIQAMNNRRNLLEHVEPHMESYPALRGLRG